MTKRPVIPTANQSYEETTVAGRNGSFYRENGYEDVPMSVEFNFLNKDGIKQQLRKVKAWLMNKSTISFSDDPNFFRKIKTLEISDTENDIVAYSKFSVSFVLDPFEYEITDIVNLTTTAVLNNTGTIESEPLIKIYGTGNINVMVNSEIFTVNSMTDYVTIDCELQEAHRNGISKNNMMVGEFPIFIPGVNNISFNGAITKIEIEPRWRYL